MYTVVWSDPDLNQDRYERLESREEVTSLLTYLLESTSLSEECDILVFPPDSEEDPNLFLNT